MLMVKRFPPSQMLDPSITGIHEEKDITSSPVSSMNQSKDLDTASSTLRNGMMVGKFVRKPVPFVGLLMDILVLKNIPKGSLNG
jgi:hypothetical protein